jgi:hypothetical protein
LSSPVGTKADAESKAPPATKAKGTEPDPTKSSVQAVAQKSAESPVAKKGDARKDVVAKAPDKGATGTLEFWISPWGDVYIDGTQVGTAPPLKTYKVPAGSHKIEVFNDNAGFPHSVTVDVKADEVLRINKSFPAAR